MREVILGLIDLRPDVTGYELRTEFDHLSGFFYDASLGHIYPTLKQLLADGLISVRSEPFRGELERKRYALTDAGREVLREWISQPFRPERRTTAFHDFQVKLTFLGALDDDAIRRYLVAGREFFAGEMETAKSGEVYTVATFSALLTGARLARSTLLWESENAYFQTELGRQVAWIDQLIQRLEPPR
jgi:DNA-binding PadR family transcriptional regulator